MPLLIARDCDSQSAYIALTVLIVGGPRHVDRGIEPRCGWQTDPMTGWRPPNHPLADDVIQLRLPAPSDAAALHRHALAEGGLEGVWLPLAFGADDRTCTALIEDWLAGWRNEASFQGPALVVVEAGHNELIGQVVLGDRGNGSVELVYGIAPHYRGRGNASSAARLVASWLLMDGFARQVELRIDKDQVASQRVAIKAGFTLAGTVVSHVPATGATYEDLRYTLSRHVVTV
jgi:RimJ/RimL family protein N-acetyltransferase